MLCKMLPLDGSIKISTSKLLLEGIFCQFIKPDVELFGNSCSLGQKYLAFQSLKL